MRAAIDTLLEGAPIPDLDHSCTGSDCLFADASSDLDGSVTDWTWDYGDSSGASGQNPQHSYSAPGIYGVTLSVADDQGQTRTLTRYAAVDGGTAICGDAVCEDPETCSSCQTDCGPCEPVCGDGVCDPTEDCNTCPDDCGVCETCDDGIQNQDETGIDCGGVCPPCPTCEEASRMVTKLVSTAAARVTPAQPKGVPAPVVATRS
jgi:hypothetical protein